MRTVILDTSGLLCPLPVIRLQNLVAELALADQVKLTATDPGVKEDIPTWCRINGHQVLSLDENSTAYTFLIEVGE